MSAPAGASSPRLTLPDAAGTVVDVRAAAARVGRYDDLPYAARVFAENLVRRSDPAALPEALEALLRRDGTRDFAYYPARVVLQDLLGTPALVDLAGLRDALAERGGDPRRVNPAVPTQLVVDHSLNVDVAGDVPDALARNMRIEAERNAERFAFLGWARRAFRNVDIVMPGHGILHQVNLERLSPVMRQQADGLVFPDTLVGTDSHTTMINALGVVGWGVGGIEAESVMLGRPIRMSLPPLVAVGLIGERRPGVQATDLVLAITEFLRTRDVVGAILEFVGPGAAGLALADRATIANMAPEYGATAALFAIDDATLAFMRLTGRAPQQVRRVGAAARALGLWADDVAEAAYDRRLRFDLGGVGRAIAGPAQPHQRIPLTALRDRGDIAPRAETAPQALPDDGAIVIAAITSCTNTSNPRNLVAAGLLAQRAVARGLTRRPWVKTSFAPGSRVAESYLQAAGLLAPLEALGFGIVGYGCTSCNGMSGPLPAAIEQEIAARSLQAVAVLSGNRNFNGRIHPRVRASFLASPALVVAYAIAGTMAVDIEEGVLGHDRNGRPVRLADLWPDDAEVDAVCAAHVQPGQYVAVYEALEREADAPDVPAAVRYAWRDDSDYIRRPPYWNGALTAPFPAGPMRALAILGDNVTTDDLSPSGAILPDSAAGRYLIARGVAPADFNSYGTRRGDHRVAVRATLANNRLRNEMTPQHEGSWARIEPEGEVLPLFDAAERYRARGDALVIVAGRNYGAGSSRDWAAKGVRLLGVRAVVAESFERIHRSNLVGMGVLPLEFEPGTTRRTLALDGSERYAVEGYAEPSPPRGMLTLAIERRDGTRLSVPVRCRIDTHDESAMFAAGGLLPRIAAELLAEGVQP
ncbi:MAG: aconitate hydratase AcnA [Proteobacteria bacterium]|nr:aconitate hydratase AcnA [Pseudomonadota bacterium]